MRFRFKNVWLAKIHFTGSLVLGTFFVMRLGGIDTRFLYHISKKQVL